MQTALSLAWLYWDPPREVFRIPVLDHPVVFYGVWFVAGFIAAYFLLIRFLKQTLQTERTLAERDVASWPALIAALKQEERFHLVVENLEKRGNLEFKGEPSPAQQQAIVKALNAFMQNPQEPSSRGRLEKWLPKALVSCKEWASLLTDRLTWYVILGTLIGARLGHVLFYDWPFYQEHPLAIFKIWEGGLASHGGVVGVMVGIWLFRRSIASRFPNLTLVALFDLLVIPSGLVACCIRIGNFFNQEIVGPQTQVPWAVIFAHPMEGGAAVPRHPTQIYEAIAYLAIFGLLWWRWERRQGREEPLRPGTMSGHFFILLFSARFLLEFFKESQSYVIDESHLLMGQYLSIPFILLGLALYHYGPKLALRCG